jgi:hypothetical protein
MILKSSGAANHDFQKQQLLELRGDGWWNITSSLIDKWLGIFEDSSKTSMNLKI